MCTMYEFCTIPSRNLLVTKFWLPQNTRGFVILGLLSTEFDQISADSVLKQRSERRKEVFGGEPTVKDKYPKCFC